jgi:hypothetical protein
MMHSRRVAAVMAWLLFVAGCAGMSGRGGQYGPDEQARAEALFTTLRTSLSAGDLEKADASAGELINTYPRFASLDECLFLASRSPTKGEHARAATSTTISPPPTRPARFAPRHWARRRGLCEARRSGREASA